MNAVKEVTNMNKQGYLDTSILKLHQGENHKL